MDEYKIETAVGVLTVQVTGNGTPAVLWHSLFVDNRSWDRVVPALARQRRLILISGPGTAGAGIRDGGTGAGRAALRRPADAGRYRRIGELRGRS